MNTDNKTELKFEDAIEWLADQAEQQGRWREKWFLLGMIGKASHYYLYTGYIVEKIDDLFKELAFLPPLTEEEEKLLLSESRKISAIKAYRSRTNLGLKQAKYIMDCYQRNAGQRKLGFMSVPVSTEEEKAEK